MARRLNTRLKAIERAVTRGQEWPKAQPQPIPLTVTEQVAIGSLLQRKQIHAQQGQILEQQETAIVAEIALRVGIEPSDIGTKYGVTPDALIPQVKLSEAPK